MSRSDSSTEDVRNDQRSERRSILGMVRRMTVAVTRKSTWQLIGVILLDGVTKETIEADVFSNIGFYSRPKAGRNAEAAVVFAGAAADNPIVVGTRDEDTRKAVADIDEDETATFNTVTIVHHKKQGFVEIRTPGGTAIKLPTLADHNAMRSAFNGHTHLYAPGPGTPVVTAGPTAVPGVVPVPAPTGTQVLKAQ